MHNDKHFKPRIRIPDWEIDFSVARSGGPGGQNVNKTATKVVIHFDVNRSKSLSDEQKKLVKKALSNHINKEGQIVLAEQSSRSQYVNRVAVVSRLEQMLSSAINVQKSRIETVIPPFVREKRVESKKARSKIKSLRKKIDLD